MPIKAKDVSIASIKEDDDQQLSSAKKKKMEKELISDRKDNASTGSNDDDDEKDNKPRRKRKRKRSQKKSDVEQEGEEKDTPEEKQNDGMEEKSAEVDRTIFVEGIPYTCKESDVREFFVQRGIDSVHLIDLRLPVWPDTGRLRGYGHVLFDSAEVYASALKLTGKYLKDRYLSIQPAKDPNSSSKSSELPKTAPSPIIILNNLSFDAAEADLEAALSKFGPFVDGGIRIVRHNATKRSRGFGFVEFRDLSSAQDAVNTALKKGITILGRSCRLDYDQGEVKPKSFRTSTGRLWEKQYGKKKVQR